MNRFVRARLEVRRWNDNRLTASVRREAASRLTMCGQVLRSHIVRLLSTPFFAVGPSKPGEPPHARTGRLRNSITAPPVLPTDHPMQMLVGTNVEYAPFLEQGTKKMAARPFISRAIKDMRSTIIAILLRKPKP